MCCKSIIFIGKCLGFRLQFCPYEFWELGQTGPFWALFSFVFIMDIMPPFPWVLGSLLEMTYVKVATWQILSADFEVRQVCLTFVAANEMVLSMWPNQKGDFCQLCLGQSVGLKWQTRAESQLMKLAWHVVPEVGNSPDCKASASPLPPIRITSVSCTIS